MAKTRPSAPEPRRRLFLADVTFTRLDVLTNHSTMVPLLAQIHRARLERAASRP